MAEGRGIHHQRDGRAGTHIKLTDEEKAVLLECRRNSLGRGIPLGVLSVIGLRYFLTQGRLPPHVQRWSIFYYCGTFFITCLAGVASYRDKCLQKLMSLENSSLANQMRQHMNQFGTKNPYDNTPYHNREKNSVRPSQDTKISASGLKERSNIDTTYSSTTEYQSASTDDQPLAFGISTTPTNDGSDSTDTQRGRTFDQIREENRKQQLQRNFNFPPNQSIDTRRSYKEDTPTTGNNKQPKTVRRNKYGDIIYED